MYRVFAYGASARVRSEHLRVQSEHLRVQNEHLRVQSERVRTWARRRHAGVTRRKQRVPNFCRPTGIPCPPESTPKAGAAVTTTAPSELRPDPARPPSDGSLAEFGYRQELHRSLGRYASFAAGFSFISVLTTVFQFFAFGYAFGGPVFFWTWPVVLVGQLAVAACFAELAARYPLSGAIYQWSSRLAGRTFGWFAGWIMVIG